MHDRELHDRRPRAPHRARGAAPIAPAAAPGSLDERVAAAETLAPSERDVARFFLEHRDEVAFLSAADVASRLGTSNATVVRAAQALGYDGLPDLRRELREALRDRATPTARLGRRLDELGDDAGSIAEHALEAQIEILESARRSVTGRDLRRATAVLGRAARIATYAVGSNAALADYFAQSARRFGRSVITLDGRGQAAADDAIAIRRGDALLVLAFERTIPEVEVILDRARRKGAASVLITDRLGLAFRGRVSATLNVERGDAGLFPLSAVVVAVLESLLLGLAGLDRARSLATLEELGALRARLPGA